MFGKNNNWFYQNMFDGTCLIKTSMTRYENVWNEMYSLTAPILAKKLSHGEYLEYEE